MGSAASTAYKLGQETSGTSTIGAGIGGMASAAKGAAANRMHNALGLRAAAARGQQAAWAAGTSGASSANASAASGEERKCGVEGKRVAGRVGVWGRGKLKKKTGEDDRRDRE